MKILSFLIRHSPGVLVLAVLTGAASGTIGALLMALVNHRLGHTEAPAQQMAWAFVGVMVAGLLANLTSRLLLLRLSTHAVYAVRMRLSRQILNAPLRKIEHQGSHRMMATLTEDILAVSDTLAEFPLLCINAAVIVAGVTYMLWLSWLLALGFAVLFVLGVLVYELIEKRTRPHLAGGREKWDALVDCYQALILGNKELKLHKARSAAFLENSLEPTARSMQQLSLRWHNIFALAAAYGQTFYFILIGSILFLTPWLGITDVSVLTGFTLTILYMNGPINFIIGTFPTFQRAAVALTKIESLGLSLSDEQPPGKGGGEWIPGQPFVDIEIEGLRYTYESDTDDRPFTLGPIDLRIVPGELLFVTGGNGSGKSSFVRLLTGLYTPDSGTISYNGRAVTDENRDHYRQNFSVVFSDYYLFDTLFGLVSPDLRERVVEYLSLLKLSDKVSIVEGRFSTTKLSQGQRKRLALLTAFMEDRQIYLFDEWAADQDPAFKEVFYLRILPELRAKGKAVIVVSHDDHYYYVADRMVKFENGVLFEARRTAAPVAAAVR